MFGAAVRRLPPRTVGHRSGSRRHDRGYTEKAGGRGDVEVRGTIGQPCGCCVESDGQAAGCDAGRLKADLAQRVGNTIKANFYGLTSVGSACSAAVAGVAATTACPDRQG
jgi:hypothetical protein